MLFRQDMMGRNFYFARQEPDWAPEYPHLIRDRWRLRKGEPGLWCQQRTMGTRLGCLQHDSQRIVRYRPHIGSYCTIQYPDLQKYWMECGR